MSWAYHCWKKWWILFAYRPPNTDKEEVFDEISVSLNKILGKYDNVILASDLSIDELRSCSDSSKNHLSDMKDIFGLTNLIKEPTCFKSQNTTLLDLILTGGPTIVGRVLGTRWRNLVKLDGQGKKSLISTFACFLNATAKV